MRRIAPNAYFPLRNVSLSEIMKVVTITIGDAAGYTATQETFRNRFEGAQRL